MTAARTVWMDGMNDMTKDKRKEAGPAILPFAVIAVCVIMADQISKYLVVSHFNMYDTVSVIDGFFNITYITNTGAAFGFMAGQDNWRHLMFQTIGVIALGGIFCLYRSAPSGDRLLLWGCSLVFGGAAGNLIDRIRIHKVIDFLDFHIGAYHWPAFNIADSAITAGGLFLALLFIRDWK